MPSVTMDKVDPGLLISHIHARRTLYDRNDASHNNRKVIDKLWEEIAEKMNSEPALLRRKWKCLRDHFRIEHNRAERIRSNKTGYSAELNTPTWRYFDTMSFLTKHMKKRKKSRPMMNMPVESVMNATDSYSTDDHAMWLDFKVKNEPGSPNDSLLKKQNDSTEIIELESSLSSDFKTEDMEETATSTLDLGAAFSDHAIAKEAATSTIHWDASLSNHSKPQEASSTTDFEILFDLKRPKLEMPAECALMSPATIGAHANDDAEDIAFFQTMLPHLRKLDAEQKFKCRMDLQQVIYNYVYAAATKN